MYCCSTLNCSQIWNCKVLNGIVWNRARYFHIYDTAKFLNKMFNIKVWYNINLWYNLKHMICNIVSEFNKHFVVGFCRILNVKIPSPVSNNSKRFFFLVFKIRLFQNQKISFFLIKNVQAKLSIFQMLSGY